MSDDLRFTIRLTAGDQAALIALCDHYGLNRPDSLRRALRAALTLVARDALPPAGCFTPVRGGAPIPIRLERKAGDGG